MARILLVDDDAEIRFLIKNYLTEEGHTVLLAGSGFDALEIINLYRFDLILIDINMPQMNGYELAQRVRKAWPTKLTPVSFLTSRSAPRDIVRARALKVDNYIIKPLNKKSFLEKVEDLLSLSMENGDSLSLSMEQIETKYLPAEISIEQGVRITFIDDVRVIVYSSARLGDVNTKVKLSAPFFAQIGYESVSTHISKLQRIDEEGWEIELMYTRPSYEFVENIRVEIKRRLRLGSEFKSIANM